MGGHYSFKLESFFLIPSTFFINPHCSKTTEKKYFQFIFTKINQKPRKRFVGGVREIYFIEFSEPLMNFVVHKGYCIIVKD